uniref:Uncharacterized protein n=1 Tax=Arundo donax TaxID=35708 RepID=A0A0A9EE92_ARUDO
MTKTITYTKHIVHEFISLHRLKQRISNKSIQRL